MFALAPTYNSRLDDQGNRKSVVRSIRWQNTSPSIGWWVVALALVRAGTFLADYGLSARLSGPTYWVGQVG
jgi:hypothetical protein